MAAVRWTALSRLGFQVVGILAPLVNDPEHGVAVA